MITREEMHTFIGMVIVQLVDNNIRIVMKSYTQKAIDFFDEEVYTNV